MAQRLLPRSRSPHLLSHSVRAQVRARRSLPAQTSIPPGGTGPPLRSTMCRPGLPVCPVRRLGGRSLRRLRCPPRSRPVHDSSASKIEHCADGRAPPSLQARPSRALRRSELASAGLPFPHVLALVAGIACQWRLATARRRSVRVAARVGVCNDPLRLSLPRRGRSCMMRRWRSAIQLRSAGVRRLGAIPLGCSC